MRRWWTILSLVLALAVLAGWLPRLWNEAQFFRRDVWPLVRLWPSPEQQAHLAGLPVDVGSLSEVDRRLPADASVVFLTGGQDVDGSEYIAFHRALYLLSPRPVVWVVQTPDPPGSRQPQWFQTSLPPNPEWLLAYQVEPFGPGQRVADLGGGSSLTWLGPGPPPSLPAHATTLWAGPAWPLGAAGALLTVLAAGWACVRSLQRFGLHGDGVESWVLAWPLGAVAISLALLLGCALGLGLRTTTVLWAVVTWVTCLWRYRRKRPAGSQDSPAKVSYLPPRVMRHTASALARRPSGWTASGVASVGLGIALALVVLYVGLLADGRPLQVWDSWVTWGMKARLIWQSDVIPVGVYADPTRAVTLLNYPLLVPLLEAWVYVWVGAPDDRLAGLVNVASYAALLGASFWAARTKGLPGVLGAGYVASIWALAGLAGLAFADIPLALFALLTGVYLVRWLEGGPLGALLVAAVAGGALAWTKREGLVLLGLFVLAALISGWRSRRWAAPALALGGALIAGPWLAFVMLRGLPDWQFAPLSLQTALANQERLRFVWSTLAHWSVESDWSFPSVWLLALVGVSLSVVRRGFKPPDLLPLVSLAYLVVLSASYLFSTFVPYQTHVLASVGRLMAHVAPLVGVWLLMRWAELRPSLAPLPRPAPAEAAPTSPRDSSADRRTPALEGLGSASGAALLPRPQPGSPPE